MSHIVMDCKICENSQINM